MFQKGQLYQDTIAIIKREAETSTAAYFLRNNEITSANEYYRRDFEIPAKDGT